MFNNLFQIIVQLNALTEPLRELLHKEVNFDWTGTCNEIYVVSLVYTGTNPYGVFRQYFYI